MSQPAPVHTAHRPISAAHSLNASSKWEDASLSVPDTPDENRTPIPPPRKKRQQRLQQGTWKAIPRPPPPQPPEAASKKRREKALSAVSLPNYTELSLSVHNEKPTSGHKTPPRNESCMSVSGKSPGISSLTVEKIENCVRRCRSFGAFKPEQQKLQRAQRHSSESDDSFDGLEDWDLGVIEHCDAHEDSPPHIMLPPERASRLPETESHKLETSSAECKVDRREETSTSETPQKETTTSTSGCKVDPAEITKQTSEDQIQEGKSERNLVGSEAGPDNMAVLVYDFVNPKKTSADVGIVNGFKESENSTGLKTPPPSPENMKSKSPEKWGHPDENQATHSTLLRLLKEFQTADGKIEDSGAQEVLKGLGLPPTLRESTSQGSSGRSSMTPSLSELEAALGDLLEASASRTGAEEDEEEVTSPSAQQTLRVMSPKPYSAFSSSFHPVQTNVGSKQLETSA